MKLPLEIETPNIRLGFDIVGKDGSLSSGAIVEAPGGVTITYQGTIERRGFDIPAILQFIVDVSVTIELSLFAAWLYDKTKSRNVSKIRIGRKTIREITPQKIKQTLEEEMEMYE
ncbi:MAG TPA: hypothetical protein ENJ13_00500 [Chromatiales bacterium]|nr:hypothetical protein [Chromatiales bacterium]